MSFISTEPLFWAVAAIVVLMVGIAKGGFGGGLVMLAVPILSFFVSPIIAAALMLPILCVMDVAGVHALWKQWDARILKFAVPCSFVGIMIGAFVFTSLSEDLVRIIVGVLAILFALNHWAKPYLNLKDRKPAFMEGAFWLTLCGFTSHIAHAGAPPFAFYILPQKLSKELFVGTTMILFAFINFVKLVPYTLSGQFTTPVLWTALVLLPLAPMGVYLGKFLMGKIDQDRFYQIIYVMVFLAGVKLVWG